jgi:hypothetical protein
LTAQTLESAPTSYCLHLDATGLENPLFYASTPSIAGLESGFQLSLVQLDGGFIAESNDVTVGNAMPMTTAILPWSPGPFGAIDVVLRAASTDGMARTTDIALALEPGLD